MSFIIQLTVSGNSAMYRLFHYDSPHQPTYPTYRHNEPCSNGNEQFIFQHIQKYNHTLAHCHSVAYTITYIYAHIRVSPSKYIDKCISRIQTCIHTLCIQNTYTYIHTCPYAILSNIRRLTFEC